ncbi:GIDE domain-containing protein [Nocardioides zeae]|uniref:RING-type E3 ubiquitin transferase n=1 Tax=Nocardioides imazamoxiresistens TaxID=3231893 RepID=A0ABU3PSV1_9ACTN|nr:GIDE domain-containing protein [Nocardioides zeae]MDT9591870.1 GIDE domain-containing protein [Nocardioides zeae]
MSWFFVAALFAVAFGAYSLYNAHRAKGEVADLLAVQASTTDVVAQMHAAALAAAGPGAYRERVELEGVVEVGPQGPLTSEVSGTTCVWHQHKVTRHYEDVRRDKDGNRRTTKRTEKVVDNRTREPFVLRDAAGTITVVPVDGVKHAHKSASEFRDRQSADRGTDIRLGSFSMSLPSGNRGGGTLGHEYEEWVLTPGTSVFVSGEAVCRNGQLELRAPEGGRLLVSTRSEAELLDKSRSDHRRNQLLGLGCLALGVVLAVVGLVDLLV